ncbi:hypothetical protein [Paraclostridium sordellii]|uniref:hypothetical protein n=1 Tax=Paraclostridium sordellii TaxID=1505 RepID=UPI000A7B54A1|nr:hypothetical protein [Paeniclostridium sordellii]
MTTLSEFWTTLSEFLTTLSEFWTTLSEFLTTLSEFLTTLSEFWTTLSEFLNQFKKSIVDIVNYVDNGKNFNNILYMTCSKLQYYPKFVEYKF